MNNGLDISVGFGRLHLKIPVMIASETSDYGEEYERSIDEFN